MVLLGAFAGIVMESMIALHSAQDSFGTATNITGDGALALIVDYFVQKKSSKSSESVIESTELDSESIA